ncbi:hypothetical protein LSAT2_024476 [Lamellibrachia satsuma]|nr:hypothetical protein LSAT2_024476 [Lamellibrachia satsuma]
MVTANAGPFQQVSLRAVVRLAVTPLLRRKSCSLIKRKRRIEKKLIVLSFCASNVFAGIFYSLPAPFFAIEAKKKGTSVTVAGLILAIYQLVCMLVTLPIGNYVSSFTEK